jgi:hypothetical protein
VNSQLGGSIKDLANPVIKNQEEKDQPQEFGVDLQQTFCRVETRLGTLSFVAKTTAA